MSSYPLRKRIKYTLLYFFVRGLIAFSTWLPRRFWLWLCGGLGALAYRLLPTFRRLTVRHLTLAFGKEKTDDKITKLSRQVYVMLGRNAGDIVRSSRIRTADEIDRFLVTRGLDNFYAAQAKGRGVLILTCHLGAFELQALNAVLRGIKLTSIGTPLKDPRLNELLHAYRNAHEGGRTVDRGQEMFRLIRALKKGEAVALLIDQDTRVKNCFVTFFGRPAATPVGAAMLALKTGAAVVPSCIYMGPDRKQYHCIFPEIPLQTSGDQEKDIIVNTQRFSDFIETQIRAHPQQWVWMHERWKTAPDTPAAEKTSIQK